MTDQTARRVSVSYLAVRDMPLADQAAACAADIPESYARRHAVLGRHFGAVCDALATGDDDALTTALLAVTSGAGAWLAAIEDELAR